MMAFPYMHPLHIWNYILYITYIPMHVSKCSSMIYTVCPRNLWWG
jgi:hypothetical protein